MNPDHDIIAAPATAAGGALAVIRISGDGCLALCDRIFRGRRPLAEAAPYTVHYGRIEEGSRIIDDVLATVFRAPHSYTGEDSAEISCHGSPYIVSEILRLLTDAGARTAGPGEFTIRAYLNGKLDLSQAEAVADMIASSSRAAHALASTQMRGGYSDRLESLRSELLHLASLLELELDFSEEDVQFADRTALGETMRRIAAEIDRLSSSFALGNAIKEGVAVAIAGAPNVGKSTLLNRLLNEERAMVSEIAGTTRDVIEECVNIGGIVFRFLDTAGIRSTDDRLERMGIERTMESIRRAQIVLYMTDASAPAPSATAGADSNGSTPAGVTPDEAVHAGAVPNASAPKGSTPARAALNASTPDGATPGGTLPNAWVQDGAPPAGAAPNASTPDGAMPAGAFPAPEFALRPDQRLLTVVNKLDKAAERFSLPDGVIGISAKHGEGIDRLREALRSAVDTGALYEGGAVVSNSRHYEALTAAREALGRALDGLADALPTDLLSEEVRSVIRHLGSITGRGAIAPDEILHNIFSKFCIGK